MVSEHNKLDVAYAEMIAESSRVFLYKVPDPDHNVAGALRRRGKLFDLMTCFIHAEPAEMNVDISRLLAFEPIEP